MPTYDYRRADGTVFEVVQPITAEPLAECPTTGQPVERIISGGGGFILKGSGFYKTDYAPKPAEKKSKSPESEDKPDKETEKATPAEDKKPDTSPKSAD